MPEGGSGNSARISLNTVRIDGSRKVGMKARDEPLQLQASPEGDGHLIVSFTVQGRKRRLHSAESLEVAVVPVSKVSTVWLGGIQLSHGLIRLCIVLPARAICSMLCNGRPSCPKYRLAKIWTHVCFISFPPMWLPMMSVARAKYSKPGMLSRFLLSVYELLAGVWCGPWNDCLRLLGRLRSSILGEGNPEVCAGP